MADYIYINDFSNKGKIGINAKIFDDLVSASLKKIPGIAKSKRSKKGFLFILNSPIKTTIVNGIVHIKVCVDVTKGTNIQKVTKIITDEINNDLMIATEQVPYDVQVRVENLI